MNEFTIVDIEDLAEDVTLFEIEAPAVAALHRAGQFVMVRPHPESERLPLAVVWTDQRLGTITLVVRRGGKTTVEMCRDFRKGERLAAVIGPLGNPTPIAIPGRPEGEPGTVVLVAGGIGAAPIVPIARAFRAKGHEVVTILGAGGQERLLLAEWLGASATRMIPVTEDGSVGRKGSEAEALHDFLLERKGSPWPVGLVVAVGEPAMMKGCAEVTRPLGIPTLVSLNAVLFDGSGGCGACPVTVGGVTKFACVDGPDIDGHAVDFDLLIRRSDASKGAAEALAAEGEREREAHRAKLLADALAPGSGCDCQALASTGERALTRPSR